MILKLLTDNGKGPDDTLDNPRRNCMILDNIRGVKVKTNPETGEQAIDVYYALPNLGLDIETFVLNHPAFLMNNSGKTIQTFYPADAKAEFVKVYSPTIPKSAKEAMNFGRGGLFAAEGTQAHLVEIQNTAAMAATAAQRGAV